MTDDIYVLQITMKNCTLPLQFYYQSSTAAHSQLHDISTALDKAYVENTGYIRIMQGDNAKVLSAPDFIAAEVIDIRALLDAQTQQEVMKIGILQRAQARLPNAPAIVRPGPGFQS